jgi:hypothetical protein
MAYKKLDGDLLLTLACPVECDFCVYQCNPRRDWMPESTIRKVAEEYTKNDIGIRICGGEPFYDLDKLEKCIDIVLEYQKPEEVLIITSGFFATDVISALKALNLIKRKKLDTLVVSVDRYHLKKVGLDRIENIIQMSKPIKIILRLTSDELSYELMDKVAEIAVKNDLKVEPHHSFGLYGKAELLDKSLSENHEARRTYFLDRLAQASGKDPGLFITQSPKRAQHVVAPRLHITTFPNGNVYGDTQCCKAAFMGNINNTSLKELWDAFCNTLPGHILITRNARCDNIMSKMLPEGTDFCDYCRNQPFSQVIPDEAIGREVHILNSESEFDKILLDARSSKRELLLSFRLAEAELNRASGRKIMAFLNELRKQQVRFILSRPLPKCVTGVHDYTIPNNCSDCRELFSVRDGFFYSCDTLGLKGPKIDELEDRSQILDKFNSIRMMNNPTITCQKCIYFKRAQCDGICQRSGKS